MTEHDFAATLPDGWVAFDPAGDADEQLDRVIRAFELDGWPEAIDFYRQRLLSVQQTHGELVAMDSRTWDFCVFGVRPDPPDDLDRLASRAIEGMSADGISTDIEGPDTVVLPAGPARRIGYYDTVASYESVVYLGEGVGGQFAVECRGLARPDDAWLSIVESFEFPPTEE